MLITHAVGFEQSILMDITNYEQAAFSLVRSAVCSGTLTLVLRFGFGKLLLLALLNSYCNLMTQAFLIPKIRRLAIGSHSA